MPAHFTSSKPKTHDTTSLKSMNILDHIEKVVEISKKHGIEKCLIQGKCHLDYMTAKLGISPEQAVLFAAFMEKSDDSYISIKEIAELLKCGRIKIIKHMNNIEELEKKRLIRCSRGTYSDISFRVPHEVIDSLRKNKGFTSQRSNDLSIFGLFAVLEQIFEERDKDELTYDSMKLELLDIINQNMHLPFCQKIMSYQLGTNDIVLLICFCHLFANENSDEISSHDLDFMYDKKITFSTVKQRLADGSHPIMNAKLVEHANDQGFINSHYWKLSDMAKKELLIEIKDKKKFQKNLVLFDTIKQKNMFYNIRETEEIQKLISLLQEENFCKILDRLDSKNMRKGFACLFSGEPGTGKTETVYQIARETQRNIMMVDISATKSMWFGESEKIVKEIFDNYRTAVEQSKTAPILLFNEADAVIGKRKQFSDNSRSVDQTENTIQNIILQEMENLSGIMIATTNLTQNMDKAFERRFLYKITFDKPDMQSRENIWNAMLPDLPAKAAKKLSSMFELSGGQIENIARKTEVDAIINGSALSLETLTQYCRTEILNDINPNKKIGFSYV